MSVFRIELTTLTPLHIGDGNELRLGFDFLLANNCTYRLNEDAILERYSGRFQPDRSGKYPLPGEVITEKDFADPTLFRYILRNMPRSTKADARLRSSIKDVYDRPYIPGSSLKGAFRTALAWTGWKETGLQMERSLLGRNRSWAAQSIERRMFGRDPNHDLLRALQVSDLFGPQNPGEGLMVVNANVALPTTLQSPIELEAILPNQVFRGSLKIDDALFSRLAENELHFGNRRNWLDELPERLRRHSLARIERLEQWFGSARDCERLANFYHQLKTTSLKSNQAFVQIGWGAGWDGKTYWTHLQTDPRLFEQIVSDYRLDMKWRQSTRKPGDPFPRSKRVAVSLRQGAGKPVAPFGWALLTFNQQ